ncbi:hypothetical protein G3I32_02700, partial [Streptomyces coelicoflavus]|nr:hypothetical protein [Streptomyces coelicoflavus]
MSDMAVAEATRAEGPTASVPVTLAAVFLPAPLPREGRIAFWDPDGGPVDGTPSGDGSTGGGLAGTEEVGEAAADQEAGGAAAGSGGGGDGRPGGPTQLTVVRPH